MSSSWVVMTTAVYTVGVSKDGWATYHYYVNAMFFIVTSFGSLFVVTGKRQGEVGDCMYVIQSGDTFVTAADYAVPGDGSTDEKVRDPAGRETDDDDRKDEHAAPPSGLTDHLALHPSRFHTSESAHRGDHPVWMKRRSARTTTGMRQRRSPSAWRLRGCDLR